ncbi:Type IV fimbrial assembly protein PilC [hydrothermal vent metagenome]|uniref:Type IV fimbrial assembly protein PilC n=1 Tax=hydrothermal vent metagenome TaxID=652676 RepID=A0A3B1AS12_9ZZZZ
MVAKAAKALKAQKSHTFTWEGADKQGKRTAGETQATNIAMARAELRRQGIMPSKVKKKSAPLFSTRKQAITPGDISIFSRQLSTMMSAGVPLVQSFDIVGRGHNNPSMGELLLRIKADIESGTALAPALAKHPLQFDDLFCNLVEAGEQAGVLEIMLDKIAIYKEKTETIKKKIKKAMTYPAAVVVVAFIVTTILLIFVVPQFEALFTGFGADLPAFTKMVVNLSEWMQEYWWIVLGGIVVASYVIGNTYRRSRKFRHLLDKAVLKAPIFGEILHKAAIARFARTLSTMSTAGVPLVEALESVAGATGNIVYTEAVLRIREDVATGIAMQMAMKQQKLFPHMVIQMVAIGEESGAVDDMLAKVADFYEEEVDNAVDSLSSLIEPIIMSILGVLVGGLVIAMYLPIFQMGQAIR